MTRIVSTLAVALISCIALSSSAPGVVNYKDVKEIAVTVQKNAPILRFQVPRIQLKLKTLARALAPLDQDGDGVVNQDLITYSLGSRVDGDRLVAQGGNWEMFATLQDVQVFLQYPGPNAEPGSGAIITYVEIVVHQNSDWGNAYIIDGGVGLRNIHIVLELGSVSSYSFIANIYGY